MKTAYRILLLLLALALVLPLAACERGKTALLTYERNGKTYVFSSRHYEFLASRAKGSLAASGVTVGGHSATEEAFWNYTEKFDGETIQTLDEYRSERLLESCKFYLVSHALFSEKGLSLPASLVEEIDDTLEELIATDAGGSKTKFNSILADYGVNYDLLRDLYLLEAEIDFLRETLYGKDATLVGNNIKDDYLESHYVRFALVRFDPFVYLYEIDENGDVIYFDTANGTPLYDKERGIRVVEDDGHVTYRLPDETGAASARYAYDEENGTPAVAMEEDGKAAMTRYFEGEELDDFRARVASLAAHAKEGAFDEVYTAEMSRLAADESAAGYTVEVYLARDVAYSSILDDLIAELEGMNPGDVSLLDDEGGSFYLFRKETVEPGAWGDESLSHWFDGFSSGLVESLFSDLCRAEFSGVKVNDALCATLPPLAKIKPNYYY